MDSSAQLVPAWLDVSRETLAKLVQFMGLVEKWNPKINLVSAASLESAWSRHVLDSAQLWEYGAIQHGTWLDIGSGGGFPGIIISIMAQQSAPDLQVTLVESDRRKCVFLSQAVRELQLSAKVVCDRIEMIPTIGAQVISARALAPLSGLLPMVSQHLASGGVALFPKGQRYRAELDQCAGEWTMQSEVLVSRTDPEGAIVRVWDLRHV